MYTKSIMQHVDVEIDDVDRGVFHLFEMRVGMNEFEHRTTKNDLKEILNS